MATNYKKHHDGLNIVPKTTTTASEKGDIEVDSTTGKMKYHNGTTLEPVLTSESTDTLKNKSVDADTNIITNLETDNFKANVIDTDNTLAADSDSRIPTQKAVKAHVSSAVGAVPVYTDEQAQDAVGGMVSDTNSIDLTYTDETPELKADLKIQNSTTVTLSVPDTNGLKAELDSTLKTGYDSAVTHVGLTSGNPHNVSKSDVGLGNVDNVKQLPDSYLDTDGTFTANSDTKVPSQKAAKTYTDTKVGVIDKLTTEGDILIRGNSGYERLGKGTAGQVLIMGTTKPTWGDASAGSGGGSTSAPSSDLGSSLLPHLTDAELNNFFTPAPNTLIDSFDKNDKGVKVNCSAQNDALRITSGETEASYTREKLVSRKCDYVEGLYVGSMQALAPKWVNSSLTEFYFAGDVSEFFTVGKKVFICKQLMSDGQLTTIALTDATNNIVKLEVSDRSYNDLTDTTTVELLNPSSLNIYFGLENDDVYDYIRVIPCEVKANVKTKASESFEETEITNIATYTVNENPVLRLPSENDLVTLGITGSVLLMDTKMSNNKQYGIIRVLEEISGSEEKYHFFWTADRGRNWTKFSSTFSGGSIAVSNNTRFDYINPRNMTVADNGKVFCILVWFGANAINYAVYSDLSVATPSIQYIPDYGIGLGTIAPAGASYISVACSDDIDAGLVGVIYQSGTAAWTKLWNFESSTPNYIGATGSSFTSYFQSQGGFAKVFGSGASRFVGFFHAGTSYYPTFTKIIQALTHTSSTILSKDCTFSGLDAKTNMGYILCRNYTDSVVTLIKFENIDSTPTFSSIKLADNLIDIQSGLPSSQHYNLMKLGGRTVVIDPSDNNHVFAVADIVHNDTYPRGVLWDIPNTSVNNNATSNTFNEGVSAFRSTSSNQKIGQTFTLSETRKIRSIIIGCRQVGNIAKDKNIRCKIYATSGNLPTGAELASSINEYDASMLTKYSSNKQDISFNFNSLELVAGVYAFVIEGDFDVSVTNYLAISDSTNDYASGQLCLFNGSTWSGNATADLYFTVKDYYHVDISTKTNSEDIYTSLHTNCFGAISAHFMSETQIEKIDSGNLLITSKRNIQTLDISKITQGHIFKRILNIAPSGVFPTISRSIALGYSDNTFDPNLIFNVSPGHEACTRRNVLTGALETTVQIEDASGICNHIYSHNLDATCYIADSDFLGGIKTCFASSQYAVYNYGSNTGPNGKLVAGTPFIIEAELKVTSLTAAHIFNSYYAVAGSDWRGWYWAIDNGKLFFSNVASGTNFIQYCRTQAYLSINTYYRVRCVYDGQFISMYYNTSKVGGTWVYMSPEVSSSPVFTTHSTGFAIGAYLDGNSSSGGLQPQGFDNLRLGYVKMALGVTQFKADGFFPQNAMLGSQNIGDGVIAKRVFNLQYNTQSLDAVYTPTVVATGRSGGKSVVNSYDLLITSEKEIAGVKGNELGFNMTISRGSDRDQSSIQGLIFQYKILK